MAPKLNRRRAVFVLSKIEEILAWEKATERERDSKFVELGRYLCEVRAGQHWRVNCTVGAQSQHDAAGGIQARS